MRYPMLRPTAKYDQVQETFLGYNNNLRIQEGEWADMSNLSPRAFPTFAPREQRGMVKQLANPQAMVARDALCWIDGAKLYINEYEIPGVMLSTLSSMLPKQMVSMGAYLVILPDKVYVNTADFSDYGYIEADFSYTGSVQFRPARVDGTEINMDGVLISTQPPTEPENGQYWIYTGGETDVLRQYSSLSESWADIPSTFTKITLPGVGVHFKQYDGVEIAGCAYSGDDERLIEQLEALNGSKILYAVDDGSIIVPGLINRVYTQSGATITVKRKMPDMDFVIESENRLWGCKYGMTDGKTVNEIYACVQGDFKNWRRYMGISTDSYAASVGTDGKFTGAITYLGYPIFFKEMNMHRVTGSMPANYRIDTMACRGVQEGSHKSLAVVNELLYYKGRTDVLCYDGSQPFGISDALGGMTYRDAVGGGFKERYYIAMRENNNWHMLMYDTKKRLWYKEDNVQPLCLAQLDDELYYIDANTKQVMACLGRAGTLEGPVSFWAQSGIIGYSQKDHKYITRMNIRAKLEANSSLSVSLRYDSGLDWVMAGRIESTGRVGTTLLPIRPRRCDHFEMRIEGTGECRILSIAKVFEVGADGR